MFESPEVLTCQKDSVVRDNVWKSYGSYVEARRAHFADIIWPSLYLKSNIKLKGYGTSESPFIIS